MANALPPAPGVDGTSILQAAIDTAEAIVYVYPGDWIISSPIGFADLESDPPALIGRSNQTIIFKSGCHIQAKVNSFHGIYQSMLGFNQKSNCYVQFEQNSSIIMRKSDYQTPAYTSGEWRHGIRFTGCTNFGVSGTNEEHIQSTGGDCIIVEHVANATPSLQIPCTNGIISNIKLSKAYRNGLSITSVNGLTLNHVGFINTLGTSPQAGCDIEPDHPINLVQNIIFNDCYTTTNPSRGFLMHLQNLDNTSSPISITFNNCKVLTDSVGFDILIPNTGTPSGFITLNNCVASECEYAALQINWDLASPILLTVNGFKVYNSGKFSADLPLEFTLNNLPTGQGILFTGDCEVSDIPNRKIIVVSSAQIGTNVRGKVKLNKQNRQNLVSQFDSLVPNLVIESYARDVRFLEKIYYKIWAGRRRLH